MSQSGTDDIWDDRLLVRAYEQAIQLQNSDVAKSIAENTNKKSGANKSQPATAMTVTNEIDSDANTTPLKVGDFVRATYHEDNVDYEAQIISIDEGDATCVVKFIGYDNEQTVRLVDLVDSWGTEEQQRQEMEAAVAAEETIDDNEDSLYPREIYRNSNLLRNSLPTPPMPPMPPMLKESLGEDTEHFSAMLMSWYMSGYYTGLYQGHKIAKQQQQQQQSKKSLKRK